MFLRAIMSITLLTISALRPAPWNELDSAKPPIIGPQNSDDACRAILGDLSNVESCSVTILDAMSAHIRCCDNRMRRDISESDITAFELKTQLRNAGEVATRGWFKFICIVGNMDHWTTRDPVSGEFLSKSQCVQRRRRHVLLIPFYRFWKTLGLGNRKNSNAIVPHSAIETDNNGQVVAPGGANNNLNNNVMCFDIPHQSQAKPKTTSDGSRKSTAQEEDMTWRDEAQGFITLAILVAG